ncbi:unnamed protein product [Boreogadus saida]
MVGRHGPHANVVPLPMTTPTPAPTPITHPIPADPCLGFRGASQGPLLHVNKALVWSKFQDLCLYANSCKAVATLNAPHLVHPPHPLPSLIQAMLVWPVLTRPCHHCPASQCPTANPGPSPRGL